MENFVALAEPWAADDLQADYEAALDFDKVAMSEENFYFNRFARVEYLPISEIERAYLRVGGLNPQQCCNTSFDVFSLVIMYGEGEQAMCSIPYEDLGREILEKLKNRRPGIIFEPK